MVSANCASVIVIELCFLLTIYLFLEILSLLFDKGHCGIIIVRKDILV